MEKMRMQKKKTQNHGVPVWALDDKQWPLDDRQRQILETCTAFMIEMKRLKAPIMIDCNELLKCLGIKI
jgi:hypothetical protein